MNSENQQTEPESCQEIEMSDFIRISPNSTH